MHLIRFAFRASHLLMLPRQCFVYCPWQSPRGGCAPCCYTVQQYTRVSSSHTDTLPEHNGVLTRRPDITNQNYETIFLLTSFALSLLLVFRTNSSYDRWEMD